MAEQHIISGPAYTFTMPTCSYTEVIFKEIWAGGDIVAVVDAKTGKSLTCRDIIHKSLQLSIHLKSMGVQRGDVVAICSENCIEYPLPILACMYLGVIVAPLNFAYAKNELQHIMNISQPRLVFCSSRNEVLLTEMRKDNKCIEHIVVFGDACTVVENKPLASLLVESTESKVGIEELEFPVVNTKSDTVFIFCSSGTTGVPKGVMITHHNLIACHYILREPSISLIEKTDVVIMFLPMFHAYGCITTIDSIGRHAKVIILAKFDFEFYLQLIQKYRATICLVVPPICAYFTKSPLVDKYDLSSIRVLFVSSAPLSKEITLAVMDKLKLNDVRQGYGMTECTLAICLQRKGEMKYGGVGSIVPGYKAKVLDLGTGETLGPFKNGELCLKGDLIMGGYYQNLKDTQTTIDEDGWMHTGDVVYYDDSKYFFIVDRLKELIKYNGFQVPPAELESLIMEIPAVREVGVIGIPDEVVGERAKAFVVLQPDTTITAEEIIKYVADRVSPQKRLHGGVQFVEDIPKNAGGKILRRILKQMYAPKTA